MTTLYSPSDTISPDSHAHSHQYLLFKESKPRNVFELTKTHKSTKKHCQYVYFTLLLLQKYTVKV